jgi:glycosyltransferase involved in cell wall biosynthesis
MTRELGQHLDPHKIHTVPNGIDAEGIRSRLSVQEAKTRLGIPSHCQVIGTAGRLEPIKRLDIFLRAASRLGALCPDLRFVIAGKGREATNLKTLANSLNLGDRVSFLGQRDDIYDVLRAFDILAITSDHEGLPMILLEAMILGVPVVCRAVGGIPEVIEDRANGVLVWSADPSEIARECSKVLADEELRNRISAEASRVVLEKYTARMTADRVLRIYHSLLGGK